MDQFTFLHAADIHLDSPLISLSFQEPEQAERIRRACRDAFENLVATAIERRVAFVILAGDLYDGDAPNMQVAVFLRHQLARLEKRGIGVFIVRQSHNQWTVSTRQHACLWARPARERAGREFAGAGIRTRTELQARPCH